MHNIFLCKYIAYKTVFNHLDTNRNLHKVIRIKLQAHVCSNQALCDDFVKDESTSSHIKALHCS